MANGIYSYAKQVYNFPSITANDIKVVLTRSYVPNYGTNQFLSDILLADRVAFSGNLASKTFVGGLFKAAAFTFAAVAAGAACDFLVVYYDTGVVGTSVLLCGLDTGFTGLPVTPDGSDIIVTPAVGGIFQI